MTQNAKAMLRRAFGDTLDENAILTLCQAAQEQSFAPGEAFLRQGEPGNTFYVLIDGRAEVTQRLDDGQEIVLDTIEPGEFVGELALLDQAPRMATCRALTPLTVLSFDRLVFTNLLGDNPAVAGLVLQHVLCNMRKQDQLIITELRNTNKELRDAYAHLQEAQAELVEKERMEREMELAADAQQSLLPGTLPDLPPFKFAAYQRTARQVGGDLYDVIALDDEHVGILLADVADKGLHAAIIMAVARTLFRTEARRSLSPAAVALAVHEGLLDLDRTRETFITAIYGVLHCPSGTLTYIRAAHEKPLLLRAGRKAAQLEGGDRFLGMLEDLELGEHQIRLQPNDILLLFSDGVPDATNDRLETYGHERLMENVASCQAVTADSLVRAIVENIDLWSGNAEVFDDLTLLAVKVTGERPFEDKG